MPKPVIDKKKCNGCKTCIDICPMQVFTFDDAEKKAKVERPSECIGCRACEAQCPQKAIKIEDN